MSDYMFMLENHLSVGQNRVVAELQASAAQMNVSLFLSGGAMRDMLGGFQVRDLDFTVEGNSLALAKTLAAKAGAKIVQLDDHRRLAELVFPGGVTAQIAMARRERYAKTGAKPQVTPATIQEDLRGRDFTINAIALSLNRASKGLLIDPLNGLADLRERLMRALHSLVLYDDPARLLRLLRLRVRLGYEIEERTKQQYDNARQAEVEQYIPKRALCEELKHVAAEPSPAEVIRVFDQERLLTLFSPALAGSKVNLPGLLKLEKAKRTVLAETTFPDLDWAPFMHVFAEKLSPKEKAALVKNVEMRKPEVDAWQKLPANARKLETALKSPRLKKPSQIYEVLAKAPGSEILFLLYQSPVRLVHDRIKNYLSKYLGLAQEITDAEVEATGVKPGTPKFEKAKAQMVAARVDGRTKKPPPPPVELPPPIPGPRGRPRRSISL